MVSSKKSDLRAAHSFVIILLMIVRMGMGFVAGYFSRGYCGIVLCGILTGFYVSVCIITSSQVAFYEFLLGAVIALLVRAQRKYKETRTLSAEIVKRLIEARQISESDMTRFESNVDAGVGKKLREHFNKDAE